MGALSAVASLLAALVLLAEVSAAPREPAAGPLRVHLENPRYFSDGSGKAVYLTGSHTWPNFKDLGPEDPPRPFDFGRYLDALERYNHNFIRLWTWELTRYVAKPGDEGPVRYAHPHPWLRSGPGNALDGKPRFDLSRFNQEYFDRLRGRVRRAGQRGFYVSIMLFEGYGVQLTPAPWRWDGHPMNARNNVNGIDGDPDGDGLGIEVHTSVAGTGIPAPRALPPGSLRAQGHRHRGRPGQRALRDRQRERTLLHRLAVPRHPRDSGWNTHSSPAVATRPKQHPVGMTFQYRGGSNETLFHSPADWVSPNPGERDEYRQDPPAGDGRKVVLNDTDHLWGIGGSVPWVWKSFTRGLNPLSRDPLRASTRRRLRR